MEKRLNLLLADDDKDDRFFFNKALQELPIPTRLTTVEDGEKLMEFLTLKNNALPDLLFLDLNMPRKNGSECLEEIKNAARTKNLPVIIYSTSLLDDVADVLYRNGAHYYVRKTDVPELKKIIHHILELVITKKFKRPAREKFILNSVEV
jgi:CheY-like chemotaxis protein